jgi:divalent metal cation (Fe/Co/Zn/Cd) transporter
VFADLCLVNAYRRRQLEGARVVVSHRMATDGVAVQTDFCVYLAGVLLAGLLLNAALGWWWADPVAALIMVPIIAKEGVEGLRGKVCNDCSTTAA